MIRASGCSGPWTSRSSSQALAEEPFGLRVFSSFVQELAQVVHRRQGLGVLGTAGQAGFVDEPPVERLGLVELRPWSCTQIRQVVDGLSGRASWSWPQQATGASSSALTSSGSASSRRSR